MGDVSGIVGTGKNNSWPLVSRNILHPLFAKLVFYGSKFDISF